MANLPVTMGFPKSRWLLSGLGVLLMLTAMLLYTLSRRSMDDAVERAAGRIGKRLEQLRDRISRAKMSGAPDDDYTDSRVGIYRFVGDSLAYWNNARIPVTAGNFTGSFGVTHLPGGYYLYAADRGSDGLRLAMLLLKPDFALENNYLDNRFPAWLGLPADARLDTAGAGFPVTVHGRKLFSVRAPEQFISPDAALSASSWLFAAGFIALLGGLLLLASGASLRMFAAGTAAVLALRVWMLWMAWPASLHGGMLYDVRLFANARSPLNGYLGDVMLNCFMLLFAAVALHLRTERGLRFLGGVVLLVASCLQFNAIVHSLVTNSTISLDFQNVFSISAASFVAIGSIALAALAALISMMLVARTAGRQWRYFAALTAAFAAALFFGHFSWEEAGWIPVVGALYFLLREGTSLALRVGLFVVAMSAVSAFLMSRSIERSTAQDLGLLSIQLAERQDAVLENEFAPVPARLQRDASLQNLLRILPSSADAVTQLLSQKYFNEYFNRYHVEYCLFDAACNPLLPSQNPLFLNEGYFADQAAHASDSTAVPGLFFVREHQQNARYIARLALGTYRLWLVMEPRQLEEMGSFPDLLLDRSQQRHQKLAGYSYAVYRYGHLTSHYGSFNYPAFLPDTRLLEGADDGMTHRYFHPDDPTVVIVSRKEHGALYFFTFNSYLLLVFSVLSYLLYLLYSWLVAARWGGSTLNRQIQTIIILILLVAMTAIGITSARMVISQFESGNKAQLEEKSGIIVNELLQQFTPSALFDPAQRDAVEARITGYARLFNTDISLFRRDGKLFVTSQPRLYKLGLASRLANPEAVFRLTTNRSSAEAVTEKAGTLNYLSLYNPVYGGGRLEGFINLPYFARQKDLANELSEIISALINVYVILFVLSVLGGLAFSGYITKPLRLIQQQLSRISLGGANEKISWSSSDEIGRLIFAYNEMLDKLEESAGLLARSERESAWKEMARQVAHEIKNPLTPMKLSLQHLQQLAKSDPEAFRDRFSKASAGIVEQIDALANIANEFSHLARLPRTRLQKVNIAAISEASVATFAAHGKVSIVNRLSGKELYVQGDPEQCLRVFNNILANALQALEGTVQPQVVIDSRAEAETMVISIADNGSGIDDDLKPRIFTPSFTTKTTGSGLGLAMVKSIMDGLGGRVWFESDAGRGTVFFLEFRVGAGNS